MPIAAYYICVEWMRNQTQDGLELSQINLPDSGESGWSLVRLEGQRDDSDKVGVDSSQAGARPGPPMGTSELRRVIRGE